MIAIVTDSTISITREEAERLGVFLVSDQYSVNGRTYLEGFADENGDFEARIFRDPEVCKTSQPPVASFVQVFEELRQKDMEVLCIVISSRLSGTYSSACIAAREVDRAHIAVVDSLSTSGGLWLLAKAARTLIDTRGSLQETVEKLEALRDKTGIVFSVNDMAALRRSGRLGIVPQSVGTVLNIRPVLMCIKGTIVARGTARGTAERVKALVSRVPQNAKEIVVHHLGERESVEPLYQAVLRRFPEASVQVAKLGPVLGIHLGAGTVGVSWITS